LQHYCNVECKGGTREALDIRLIADAGDGRRERRQRLGAYLKRKRAAVSPDAYSLPVHRRRRVAGLRREEVALLAGMSVTWYTQLESGAEVAVSPSALRRIADALMLTQVERAFLFALAIEEMDVMNAVMPQLELLSGCRIAAETFEGEIETVLRAHRGLKTQIYASLVNGTIDDLKPHLDETRCPIGLWLHDDLAPGYRTSAQYTRAARIHAAFHREIDRVVQAGSNGDAHHVEHLLVAPSRYVLASAALERAFSTWPEVMAAKSR
jgi:transcriptional regulator with XRE-family HTH domain